MCGGDCVAVGHGDYDGGGCYFAIGVGGFDRDVVAGAAGVGDEAWWWWGTGIVNII